MKRINERAWEVFGIYGRVCESCSGAIALSLLQALAMFGCLEKREAVGLTLYCILTFIAVVATIGFFASLISIGRTIHIQSEGHKVAEFLISCVFYPVVIGIHWLVRNVLMLKSPLSAKSGRHFYFIV